MLGVPPLTVIRAAVIFAGMLGTLCLEAAPPVVTNVRASQRAGTKFVDIYYDVSASVPPLTVAV